MEQVKFFNVFYVCVCTFDDVPMLVCDSVCVGAASATV